LLVVVLALSLAFIACNSGLSSTDPTGPTSSTGGTGGTGGSKGGGGGGGGSGFFPSPTPQTPEVLTFASGEGANKVEITITQNLSLSKAVYAPKNGDTYVIKKGGVVISSGTVTVSETVDSNGFITNTFTFKPGTGEDNSFTATYQFGELTFAAPITPDKGGEPVNIPPLKATAYEKGVADSDPKDTGTTIAGIPYSEKVTGSWIMSDTHTYYFIPNWVYEDAKRLLNNRWSVDGPSYETDEGYYYGATADWAMENEGALFIIFTRTITTDSGTTTDKDYRLAVWVEADISGDEGEFTSGSWETAVWDEKTVGNLVPNATPGPGSEGGSIAIGSSPSITYSKNNTSTVGPTTITWTSYALEGTYADALKALWKLWGDPMVGVRLRIGGGLDLLGNPDLVFEISASASSDAKWTNTQFRLVKYSPEEVTGVGWRRC